MSCFPPRFLELERAINGAPKRVHEKTYGQICQQTADRFQQNLQQNLLETISE